jgi:hypothetical protein
MRSPRLFLAALGTLALGASVVAAMPSHAASPLAFGHETVLDHQRSGFEPDVVITSKGALFSSVPNGSSQGESFVWKSVDHGDSFQLVPGNVAFGKPATCVGGGDTELAKDAGDNLYLSDLQNLTNLSNSVSTDGGMTFKASCTAAPNTPVDRMWFASHGKLGDPDFAIYEEYDAVLSNTSPSGPGNQLVETVSHDGVNFLPVINAAPSADCLGGGEVNCVTNNESLPGNQLVNHKGELVVAHGGGDGSSIYVSIGKPVTTGTGNAAVTTALWHDVLVNGDVCPHGTGVCGSTNFPTIAQDAAGTLYMVNAAQPSHGPYEVFLNVSRDGGHHWSRSMQVSTSGSNAFPWVTAGSAGRVGIAWYHANEEGENNHYAFDDLAHAEFDIQVAQSVDALSAHPHFAVVTASEHPMKYGPICTAGTACAATMGDRSLGDYLNIGVDTDGALVVAYVDDTSNSFTVGPTGAVAENGPPVMQRQVAGPSMYAGRTLRHSAVPFDRVADPSHDDFFSANTLRTPAGDNLDLTSSSVTDGRDGLTVRMKVRSLESLQVSPTLGGTTGLWVTRFTAFDPHTNGNGHIYYAAMESTLGQKPRFFVGDVDAPNPAAMQISMAFESAKSVPATALGSGTITFHIPWSAVPGLHKGDLMYSVTAFTATALATLQANPQMTFNVIDSTPAYDHVVGGHGRPSTVRPRGFR